MTNLERKLITTIVTQANEIWEFEQEIQKLFGLKEGIIEPLESVINKITQPIDEFITSKKEFTGEAENQLYEALYGGDFTAILSIIEELEKENNYED